MTPRGNRHTRWGVFCFSPPVDNLELDTRYNVSMPTFTERTEERKNHRIKILESMIQKQCDVYIDGYVTAKIEEGVLLSDVKIDELTVSYRQNLYDTALQKYPIVD